MIFLIIDFSTIFSTPKSCIMVNTVSDEVSDIPRAVIYRFMEFIFLYCERKSFRRGSHFVALRLLLITMFVSNSTVNSKKYKEYFLEKSRQNQVEESHR